MPMLPTESSSPGTNHPLNELAGLSTEHLGALQGHWITTVEELIAACRDDTGREGLCRLLRVSQEELVRLLVEAEQLVGADTYQRLSTAQAGGPLGLLLTDEQRRTAGFGDSVPGLLREDRGPDPLSSRSPRENNAG